MPQHKTGPREPQQMRLLFLPTFSSPTPLDAVMVQDEGSIPGPGRSPGEENGNPLQCSCLENPMDREVWQAVVHGVPKSRTWLSDKV